jgi:hypothetical protein
LRAVSLERKDFAVEKGNVAYFCSVVITLDLERSKSAVAGKFTNAPGKPVYRGWIPEKDFYAISPEQFDRLMAQKKIPMTIR